VADKEMLLEADLLGMVLWAEVNNCNTRTQTERTSVELRGRTASG